MAVTISSRYAEEIASVDETARQWTMGGGTEKQINWAKELRRQYLADTLTYAFEYYERRHSDAAAWRQTVAQQVAERVSRVVNAKFWIENRSFLSSSQLGQDVTALISAKER